MAGAYTALAEDSSGCYFNPSGLSFSKEKELSISGQAFYQKETVFKEAIIDQDFIETSSGMYPNFIGASFKSGGISTCLSLINLDYQDFNQNDRFENVTDQNGAVRDFYRTHQENGYYLMGGIGGAYRMGILGIGASGFLYRRSIQSSNHQFVVFNGGSTLVQDAKYTTNNHGYGMSIGLMLRFSKISIGFSTRKMASLSDKTLGYVDRVTYIEAADGGENSFEQLKSSDVSFDELNPVTHRLGLAWLEGQGTTWSVDFLFHEGKDNFDSVDEAIEKVILMNTMNFSIGVEMVMSPMVFRTGFFSNLTMFPAVDPEVLNQRPHVDYFGMTLGVAFRGNKSENSIGLLFQKGEGEAQIISNARSVQDVESHVIIASWNTQYSL